MTRLPSLLCPTSFLIIPHSAKAADGLPIEESGGNRFACGPVYMSDVGESVAWFRRLPSDGCGHAHAGR